MNTKITAVLLVQFLAQTVPDAGAFERYGLPGAVIAFFVWQNYRQTLRNEEREKARDDQMAKREESNAAQIMQLVQSVNSLVRVTSIEVMTRPGVIERARTETDEILKSLPAKP